MASDDSSKHVTDSLNRRRLLSTLGSAGIFGVLAGCVTDDDSNNNLSTPLSTTVPREHSEPMQTSGTRNPTPTSTQTPTTTSTQTSACANDVVSMEAGELPIHRAISLPAKAETRGIDETEARDIDARKSTTSGGSIPESSFHLEGLIDGTGVLAMNTGAAFTSYWEPPTTGEFVATGAYFGGGEYEYAPQNDSQRDYTLCFESNISVIKNCQQVVASSTQPDLRHGNSGIQREAAENLLEYLAYALVAPYLGIVGRFIAKAIISWAIELDMKDSTQGSFFIDPSEPHETEVSFTAREGELYAIQYTPSIGFVGESYEDWLLTSQTRANYYLDSLSVSKNP